MDELAGRRVRAETMRAKELALELFYSWASAEDVDLKEMTEYSKALLVDAFTAGFLAGKSDGEGEVR